MTRHIRMVHIQMVNSNEDGIQISFRCFLGNNIFIEIKTYRTYKEKYKIKTYKEINTE